MIHKFKQGDLAIVMDVNGGAIHVVDDLIYDVLDFYPEQDSATVIKNLENKYSEADLVEAMSELDQLLLAGQLETSDQYIDDIHFNQKKPVIKAMCLHVAHDCNIRCKYCFASQGDFKGDRGLMNYEVGKQAFDLLVSHSGNRRNLEVDFFGGEPLMNWEVVKQLVDYGRSLEAAHNKNFRFTLTTNGVLLDDEKIEYINENMENVVLSLDGTQATNDLMRYTVNGGGTYDIIVPKFQKLVEKRGTKSYYVRGTFTHFNTDFAKDVIHMADLGFKLTSVEPVVSEPHHDYTLKETDLPTIFSEYERLAEEIIARSKTEKAFKFFHFMVDLSQGPCVIKRLSGCGAGSEYIAVTPEGDIYPCHQFVGNEDFKMGNVAEGTVDLGINQSFKNAHVYNKPKCKDCWAKFYCSGGCHANAYNFNKDINMPYDLGCEMEKKRLECAIYIKAKEMTEA